VAIATESSGSVLHLAWSATGGTPNPNILYVKTTGGLPATPLSGTSVLDGTTGINDAGAPVLAVLGSGATAKVFVVWQDRRQTTDPDSCEVMFAETKSDGSFGTNTRVSHVLLVPGVNLPGVTDRAETIASLGLTGHGEPYVAWTDQPLAAGAESHIYFAEGMCARDCGAEPAAAAVTSAGGTGSFSDPTNPHVTQVTLTVPAAVFDATRELVATELRNPVSECQGGSGLFSDGAGLYLEITGGTDAVLSDWVTITVTLAQGITLPAPLTIYRLVPPATPLESWTWTTDDIRNASYNAATRVLSFQTKHLSSFGAGSTPAPAASGGSSGGGGGCAMDKAGQPDIFLLLLPLAALGVWVGARRTRMASKRPTEAVKRTNEQA
jgi:hypothetical protein